MCKIFLAVILLFSTLANAQPLRDLNFNYLYKPTEEFILKWKIVNLDNQLKIYYSLETPAGERTLETYSLQVEIRNELSDKEGTNLGDEVPGGSEKNKSGFFILDSSHAGKIAVMKIFRIGRSGKTVTLFYKSIPSSTTPALFSDAGPVIETFTRIHDRVTIQGFSNEKPLLLSYYDSEFPAAGPPFSTAQGRVSAILKPDSSFISTSNTPLTFTKKGLYLAQRDTASAVGLAFRVEDDYPKLGKLESLHGPMIYICTKLEYDKLRAAGTDKGQFDKVILSITGNTDRAKIFMRNYFKRVEQANTYFSSYKEGWKTDRGMIYIIYGVPDGVYLSGEREVWEYKNTTYKGRFTFVRSATLFDPENYVLLREKKFSDDWYQMIDLWRKARF